ncbi:hypothetical protein H5U98_13735 [Mycolicibacterium boenickei]|uniref:Secreted protein n=1 Tax=Mycolicibacterium boenickei TaxID=146017 RepID=A0AAX3A4C1_9MYCO|nr:hypothetical protein [Mycolicibacterium boenickei]PEG60420.1 hypothetical protein CQY21_12965 [Mycolicibacterium boenickei]UNC02337.1 hypothetical protein H5U98_13735 [Mycolicibacterium boenickei]BBX92325.1 hypothetical protein MBOE_39740 [Mycolicibacterium boenickei]
MHSGESESRQTLTLDESVLVDAEEPDRPVVDFLRATPGRIAVMAVVLIAAVLTVGVTSSVTAANRQRELETLRLHTEPLADAAQRIYSALSSANTTAATAFLAGGVEPRDVRDRYDAAVGEASAGLITAANGVSPNDIHSLTLLTDLSNQLAVYTGMMGTARAANRDGRPIGVAYLSESSTLLQESMLPDAERLYRAQAHAVTAAGRSAAAPPALVAGAALAVGLLVFAQVFLARRSHRRLNLGLVLASVLMTVLAVWLTVAGLVVLHAVNGARTEGGEPLESAVTARILVQQARADEILGLLKRGSDAFSDIRFEDRTTQVGRILDGHAVNGAQEALHGWRDAHAEIRAKLTGGDYPGAVAIARDDGQRGSTAQFARLDQTLGDDIARLRDRQRDGITRAYAALNALPAGAAAISVLAALAVAAGVAPRLSEYH